MDSAHELWPFGRKAAVFDFDGTLADTAHIWYEVDHIFLNRRNLPYPDGYGEQLAALGFARGAQYTIDLFGLDESVEEICDEWNDIGRTMYREQVVLREGASNYILALRAAGIPCALATTNDVNVLSSMQSFAPRDYFDVCTYGAEVGVGKDRPDIYLESARRLGMDPKDCLVFEDIVVALQSAKSTGMRTCGVRSSDPSQPAKRLRELSDLWLDDWRDIPL